jgi:hypothetical protein
MAKSKMNFNKSGGDFGQVSLHDEMFTNFNKGTEQWFSSQIENGNFRRAKETKASALSSASKDAVRQYELHEGGTLLLYQEGGKFWLIPDRTYSKWKRAASENLFDGKGIYGDANYLIRPAEVKSVGDNLWELVEKGELSSSPGKDKWKSPSPLESSDPDRAAEEFLKTDFESAEEILNNIPEPPAGEKKSEGNIEQEEGISDGDEFDNKPRPKSPAEELVDDDDDRAPESKSKKKKNKYTLKDLERAKLYKSTQESKPKDPWWLPNFVNEDVKYETPQEVLDRIDDILSREDEIIKRDKKQRKKKKKKKKTKSFPEIPDPWSSKSEEITPEEIANGNYTSAEEILEKVNTPASSDQESKPPDEEDEEIIPKYDPSLVENISERAPLNDPETDDAIRIEDLLEEDLEYDQRSFLERLWDKLGSVFGGSDQPSDDEINEILEEVQVPEPGSSRRALDSGLESLKKSSETEKPIEVFNPRERKSSDTPNDEETESLGQSDELEDKATEEIESSNAPDESEVIPEEITPEEIKIEQRKRRRRRRVEKMKEKTNEEEREEKREKRREKKREKEKKKKKQSKIERREVREEINIPTNPEEDESTQEIEPPDQSDELEDKSTEEIEPLNSSDEEESTSEISDPWSSESEEITPQEIVDGNYTSHKEILKKINESFSKKQRMLSPSKSDPEDSKETESSDEEIVTDDSELLAQVDQMNVRELRTALRKEESKENPSKKRISAIKEALKGLSDEMKQKSDNTKKTPRLQIGDEVTEESWERARKRASEASTKPPEPKITRLERNDPEKKKPKSRKELSVPQLRLFSQIKASENGVDIEQFKGNARKSFNSLLNRGVIEEREDGRYYAVEGSKQTQKAPAKKSAPSPKGKKLSSQAQSNLFEKISSSRYGIYEENLKWNERRTLASLVKKGVVEQRENEKYYVVREKKAKSSSKSTKPKTPQPSIDVPEDWSLQKSQEEDTEPLWEEEEEEGIKEWEKLYKSRKSSGELSDRDYDQLEDQFLALDPSSQKKFRVQLKRDAKKDPNVADLYTKLTGDNVNASGLDDYEPITSAAAFVNRFGNGSGGKTNIQKAYQGLNPQQQQKALKIIESNPDTNPQYLDFLKQSAKKDQPEVPEGWSVKDTEESSQNLKDLQERYNILRESRPRVGTEEYKEMKRIQKVLKESK